MIKTKDFIKEIPSAYIDGWNRCKGIEKLLVIIGFPLVTLVIMMVLLSCVVDSVIEFVYKNRW